MQPAVLVDHFFRLLWILKVSWEHARPSDAYFPSWIRLISAEVVHVFYIFDGILTPIAVRCIISPVGPSCYLFLHAFIVDKAGSDKPWILITGGVHGYETSGVQGALQFVRV